MSTIKGHFDGQVVILDEPSPVRDETSVLVQFPDTAASNGAPVTTAVAKKWHWRTERLPGDTYEGCVSDEVIRQRRED